MTTLPRYTEALRRVTRAQNELLEAEREAHAAWIEEVGE